MMLLQGDYRDRLSQVADGSVSSVVIDPPYNLVGKIKDLHVFNQSAQQGRTNITPESMSFDAGFDQIDWISSINLDRDFIGIELDDDHFKLAQKRIHNAVKIPKELL